MIPAVGSEWIARDGRKMRVESVTVPENPSIMPRARLTVLNAQKGMRKTTEMSTGNFGSEFYFGFLRPAKASSANSLALS